MLINALIPIVLPIILIVGLKMSAKNGMVITALIFFIVTWFVWGLEADIMLGSIIKGVFSSLNILLILFGAIVLLNTLKRTGAIGRINEGFAALSKDMRIQAILVAFLFGSLIEGASGFGTPAVVVGPLLLALGFAPLSAVTLALISDSMAVSYGAVGTPVNVGFQNLGLASGELLDITKYATRIDLLAGAFVPIILVFVLTYVFGEKGKRKIRDTVEMAPFALIVGFAYTLFAFGIVRVIGYEFTSILAPIFTIITAVMMIKYRIFIPKNVWTTNKLETVQIEKAKSISLLKSWLPYILVVGLLLLTRIVLPVREFVTTFLNIRIDNLFNINEISLSWPILYSPGTVLLISAIIGSYIQSGSFKSVRNASKESFDTMMQAAVALIFTLAMVQVFSSSGIGLDVSMPAYIASVLVETVGGTWYLIAPFIGQLGAFITGSATVSNLTFSPIQYEVATQIGANTELVLAEQLLGGASGNMICIHNIVAAATVVGLVGKEGEILRKTIMPAMFYGIIIGVSALLISI